VRFQSIDKVCKTFIGGSIPPRASKSFLTLKLEQTPPGPDPVGADAGREVTQECFSKPGNLGEERLQQAELALRARAITGDRVQPRSDGTSQW
jgi:hypothetical protein